MFKYIFFYLIFFFSPLISFTQDLTNGRIAYYPFNGNSVDEVGANNGMVYGATLIPDRFGTPDQAYYFDGINDYIEIPHSPTINFGVNDDFSISFWVRVEDQKDLNGNNDIIGKWTAYTSTGYPYAIRYYSQYAPNGLQKKILAIRYDTHTCNHTPRVQTDCQLVNEEWLHIVFIKTGKELTMFLNGELESTATDNTSESCGTDNSAPIMIGMRYQNTRHFTGSIDDISFYNRALSKDEVNLIFKKNGWTAPPEPNTDIISFDIPQQIKPPEIDFVNNTINVTVTCNTDLSQLVPTFAIPENTFITVDGVSQVSGSSTNNFTEPKIYSINSNDGCITEDWLVTVKKEEIEESEADLKTSFINFYVPHQIGASIINPTSNSINITVPCYFDLTNITPAFIVYDGATVFVENERQINEITKVNFSQPVTYTVNSSDACTSTDWVITIRPQEIDKAESELQTTFINFAFSQQVGSGIINTDDKTIEIGITCTADITQLTAFFTVSDSAKVFIEEELQISGKTKNNFTEPITYTVISQDSCSITNWIVSVDNEKASNVQLTSNNVPNVITPNNDGKNDVWEILTKDSISSFNIKVYNRWGKLVYSQNDYDNQWNADWLSVGVYFYTITNSCDSKDKYKGLLHVIK